MTSAVRVRILNVGQGDALVGILPGGDRAFVADVYDADKVLDFLAAEGVSEVVLFVSHSDQDHTAGVAEFLAEFPRNGRVLAIFYSHDRLNAHARSEYVHLAQLDRRLQPPGAAPQPRLPLRRLQHESERCARVSASLSGLFVCSSPSPGTR